MVDVHCSIVRFLEVCKNNEIKRYLYENLTLLQILYSKYNSIERILRSQYYAGCA